jgi:hypothetical protein
LKRPRAAGAQSFLCAASPFFPKKSKKNAKKVKKGLDKTKKLCYNGFVGTLPGTVPTDSA